MTVQTFRDPLISKPFKPFRVVMSSGEKHEARRPALAFLSKTSLYIGTDLEHGIPAEFRI